LFIGSAGTALILLASAILAAPGGAASVYPVLPEATYTQFLSGLSVAPVAPGGTTTLSLEVRNPLGTEINGTVVTLEFYAFNPYPGNSPGPLPSSEAVEFVGAPGVPGSENMTVSFGTLGSDIAVFHALTVEALGAAGTGTYAIRTAVRFTVGATPYLLESRGFFNDAQWENATASPNGNATLNVSRLGVSGVTPETGVLVQSNTASVLIWAFLAAALALAGVAAFYVFRRGPRSKSGARGDASPQSAPNAFGNKRTKDGD
jgi:hypothetical protein